MAGGIRLVEEDKEVVDGSEDDVAKRFGNEASLSSSSIQPGTSPTDAPDSCPADTLSPTQALLRLPLAHPHHLSNQELLPLMLPIYVQLTLYPLLRLCFDSRLGSCFDSYSGDRVMH
ncbi:uncharacterized protein A4U43_C07F21290 [Asparagus officinalis]|uniref:Uncharacterized protein n=1 Tax=Asparagus officinalis TaxID=4686 RepID=A0A5P1EH39_ASPOF|nr:uncharacterized protein A4U43_C07F21290 [Asparagus officinalis]